MTAEPRCVWPRCDEHCHPDSLVCSRPEAAKLRPRRTTNLLFQSEAAHRAMEQYRRNLRDCGFHLVADEARPPMCLSGDAGWRALTHLGQLGRDR